MGVRFHLISKMILVTSGYIKSVDYELWHAKKSQGVTAMAAEFVLGMISIWLYAVLGVFALLVEKSIQNYMEFP